MGLTQSRHRRNHRRSGYEQANTSESTSPPPDSSMDDSMPGHWRFVVGDLPEYLQPAFPALRIGWKALALASLGHSDLEDVWLICLADERAWFESTDRLYDRLNTIVVVAGLLLSSTAAFLTTTPPIVSDFNYNTSGVYICLLLSFGTSLGTLIVGSAIMFVVSKCGPDWFRSTHMSTRSRVISTMYLIAYPFFSMAISGAMAAIGLLVTAWGSQNQLVKKGGVWLVLFPLTCLPLWVWTQVKPKEGSSKTKPEDQGAANATSQRSSPPQP